MVQRRNRARFTLETLGELLFRDLNRNVPVKPLIARQPNRSHAAFANRTEEVIRAEICAGGKAHGVNVLLRLSQQSRRMSSGMAAQE